MEMNYSPAHLADRAAIIDLNVRYAHLVDSFQLEPVLELWDDNAIFDERETGYGRYEGKASLRAFYRDTVFAPTKYMSHLMCNHLVDRVEGDRAYGAVFARADILNKENLRIWFTIKYEDEYIRSPRGWRFLTRIVRMGIAPDISTYDDTQWRNLIGAPK